MAGEFGVDSPQPPRLRHVDEQAVHVVEEVVAGGAMDLPLRRQVLAAGQDLFGDHIQRVSIPGSVVAADGCFVQTLQHFEIACRIEEAVRVVDADTVYASVGKELPEKLVRRLEYLRPLHVKRGQRVHVEEPPVIDLVRRGAPVRQPIRLHLEQLVKGIETRRVAGDSVHVSHRIVDVPGNRRFVLRQSVQPRLRHFFLAVPLRDSARVALGVGRQILE